MNDLSTIQAQLADLTALLTPPVKHAVTVQAVIDAYIADLQKNRCNLERVDVLRDFARSFGPRRVIDCTPLELKTWLRSHGTWKSNWTIMRGNATINRAFNWAHGMGMIVANTFRGIRCKKGPRKRPMTDEEFKTALRYSPFADFRRVLIFLRFTGARPSEARDLQWGNVDWERRCIRLTEHKTADKTGRPRIIALCTAAVKLLDWIRRHPAREASTEILRKLLADGPQPQAIITHRMLEHGFTYHAHCQARRRLDVRRERRKLPSGKAAWFYIMPAANGKRTRTEPGDYVFVNTTGRPWDRHGLAARFTLLRRRAGLPRDCFMYGLRHGFGTTAVRKGVGLKTVSELLGHADTRMTEHYIHLAGDVDHLHEGLAKMFP